MVKRKKYLKRVVSVILSLIMVVTMIPIMDVTVVKAGTTLLWPVPSCYMQWTTYDGHNGIDIAGGRAGETVVAAIGGSVYKKFGCNIENGGIGHCYVTCCNGFGNGVVILGDDGRYYQYAHMMSGSIPPNVQVGARVNQGDMLGKVGRTGAAQGYHLHFSIMTSSWWQGWINPINENYVSQINVVPNVPSNVSINKSNIGLGDAIIANWSASAGATSYKVTLTCTTNSAYNKSVSVGGTSTSFSIEHAGSYKVSVSASNSAGTSGTNSSGICVAHENVTVKYLDWENQIIGKEQSVKWGGNAIAPAAPIREGYTFQNWSDDGKGITEDTIIKANYKINTYSVAFVDYNGDVIDKVQKVEWSSSAIEPTEIPCKEGYIFAGWDTNEYKNVNNSLTVKATYVWENSDLPIITKIESAIRNNEATGYDVNVNITNFPDDFTKGKLVVALMTKDGKMVASETSSISMPETGEVSNKITVLYSGLASRVQVSMIGVMDDETTGTPKSKIVTGAVDIGNEWSDWSTTVPEGEDIIKESRTEYRYKDSKVIKSTGTPTTPAGYSLTSTANTGTYTSWGAWSGWSRTTVSSNSLRDVRSQNGYRIYAYVCSACGRRDPFGGSCSNCGRYTLNWIQTEDTLSGYQRGYLQTAENGDWIASLGRGRVIIYDVNWYFELNGSNNGEPQSPSVSGNGTGQVIYPIYSYRTRQEYKNYTYWQNEFSDWQPEKVENSSTKKVETRTTYRFKTNSIEVPCYNYKRYKYTNINNGKIVYTYTSKYADSMEYPGAWEYNKTFTELKKVATVDDNISLYNGTGEDSWYSAEVNDESESKIYQTKDTLEDTEGVKRSISGKVEGAAGKVATLLVYKGKNEDPIASQIEYIGQTTIAKDGSYNFNFITKEEPTAKTGDFIITLGIEGTTNYQVIGKIEAPKQVFTVDFVDDLGNSIGEQKKVADGGTVEAPSVPDKEGYDFIGWDTGLKNIRENMVITAQYKKKKCTVIFVDWDKTSIDIKEYEYGDKLTIDNYPIRDGKKFAQWVDEDGNAVNVVKKNMIVSASYKDTTYTIIFKDWEGNIISQQTLSYGEEADIPESIEAPNDIQVFKCWDGYDKAKYVTGDAIISPVPTYIKDSEKPKYIISDEGSEKKVSLYSTKGNTEIYYAIVDCNIINSDVMGIDENEFCEYEDEIKISEDSVILAYAKTKDSNESELEAIKVSMISDEDPSENNSQNETTTNQQPSIEPTTNQEQTTSEKTTEQPTVAPTEKPTKKPTEKPTDKPSVEKPTKAPETTTAYVTPKITKPSIKKLSNLKGKKVKITLNKLKVSYKEYVSKSVKVEIVYAKDKKFKKSKKIKKYNIYNKSTSKTISKLKKKQTYYFKVRYRIEYWDTKYKYIKTKYSSWSNPKKIKVNK